MIKVTDPKQAVEQLLKKVGNKVVMAAPLAAGKPNHFLNALYEKAKEDSSIDLTILTALSLQIPQGKSDLEKRFLNPFAQRVFAGYPDLEYEKDRMKNTLPTNIKLIEFYFLAGKYQNRLYDQKNYLSSNYTHAVRDIFSRGVNAICQQVSPGEIQGKPVLSLSCNSDLTSDLADMMKAAGRPLARIAQTNQDLPFMYGESVVGEDFFDVIIDNPEMNFPVFAPPKMSVSPADHMIGLYASTLIKDDGEIQIGIGSLGDALVYSLCLREKGNKAYRDCLNQLDIDESTFPVIKKDGNLEPFQIGLFAATEMLVDSFAELYKAGILKKKVYDSVIIQRLLNLKRIKESFSDDILEVLLEEKAISSPLTQKDFEFLKEFGIFKDSVGYENGLILLENGEKLSGKLKDQDYLSTLKKHALGTKLRNGAVAHGGFFLGPRSFYNFLKDLPVAERKLFRMKRISQINQLYGHEEIDRLQRTNGRFVNTCMKVSLNGGASSDALESGQQISGVGGQYNFVAMAHELPDARSILQLRSTRVNSKGQLESNIVFNYGNCTIPRHLRDIVITEYGIADLRGKTDEEVAIELIQIADSRCQGSLIQEAIKGQKLSPDFQLKPRFKNNYPERYTKQLLQWRKDDLFMPFPFGTDLTDIEIQVGAGLKKLKALQKNKVQFIGFIIKSLFVSSPSAKEKPALKRMALDQPKGFKEWLYSKLVLHSLRI